MRLFVQQTTLSTVHTNGVVLKYNAWVLFCSDICDDNSETSCQVTPLNTRRSHLK